VRTAVLSEQHKPRVNDQAREVLLGKTQYDRR
jgi:hypothetical protein